MSNYSDDKKYMAWWAENGELASPRVEYGAWLAGKEAAEASAVMAERELLDMTQKRDSWYADCKAAEARATELAAQLNQVNAYLQSAIEERNRAEFELSSARNALRDIANGKYADPKNFAAAWINAHSFEPDVQT